MRVRADLGRRKLGRQLEGAGKDGAHFAVVLGDELQHGQVQLRDLMAGSQHIVALAISPRSSSATRRAIGMGDPSVTAIERFDAAAQGLWAWRSRTSRRSALGTRRRVATADAGGGEARQGM